MKKESFLGSLFQSLGLLILVGIVFSLLYKILNDKDPIARWLARILLMAGILGAIMDGKCNAEPKRFSREWYDWKYHQMEKNHEWD